MPSGFYRTPAVLYKFIISNLGAEIAAVLKKKSSYDVCVHSNTMETVKSIPVTNLQILEEKNWKM